MSRLFSIFLALISVLVLKLAFNKLDFGDREKKSQSIISQCDALLSVNLEKTPSCLSGNYEFIFQKAQSTTVKVLAGESWGSGIVIKQQDDVYTVVTNRHVLVFSPDRTYQIQTPDGETYQGKILETVDFGDRDLALIEFKSDRPYQIAVLNSTPLNSTNLTEEKVFAGGYPIEIEERKLAKGFYFDSGNIARLSSLEFGGGYQIGYTNSVKKGMSGGPLLNSKGEVIGINGVDKYPLWGNPYLFSDGSLATENQRKEMSQFSWAIPISTFLQLAPQFQSSQKSQTSIIQ